MFIGKTWQDLQSFSGRRQDFILAAVNEYVASEWYRDACRAERYAGGDTDIRRNRKKMAMQPVTYKDNNDVVRKTGELAAIATNYVSNNMYGRLVQQRIQYLYQNGMALDKAQKAAFGADIDAQIERAAHFATIHGETYLFWDLDKVRQISAASADGSSGMFFLLDEMTGVPNMGIRFWRIASDKPRYVQVYSAAGWTLYAEKDGELNMIEERGYISTTRRDVLGATNVQRGYDKLPFVVFKANDASASTLTHDVRSKIDLYDKILSDLGDNLERMEGIYWVIKNFGGDAREARAMLAELEQLRTAVGHDDGTEAHPEAIEAPYAAREFALNLLERQIYKDFMALNMDEITGGSLTNVAINVAKANLDLAANQLETQTFAALYDLLAIIGKSELYADISKYKRQAIGNQLENVEMVYNTGLRQDIPREKALQLTGLFEADEIAQILKDMDADDVAGLDNAEKLQQLLADK